MSVKSAKLGNATFAGTPIGDVTDIQIVKTTNPKEYASSSTAGKVSRRPGHEDITGSFKVKADALAFDEGDSGTLLLKSDAAVTMFNATALIGEISFSLPIEGADLIEATVTFGQMPA